MISFLMQSLGVSTLASWPVFRTVVWAKKVCPWQLPECCCSVCSWCCRLVVAAVVCRLVLVTGLYWKVTPLQTWTGAVHSAGRMAKLPGCFGLVLLCSLVSCLHVFVDLHAGKLHVAIDPAPFVGINSVPDAVAHLHSGASMGKVGM